MNKVERLSDLIANGWVKINTGPFGSALHKHEYQDDGVSVVPAEAIVDGELDSGKFNFVTVDKAEALKKYALASDDIVFARRGAQACGHSAFVKNEDVAKIAGTGLIFLRILRKDIVDPYFLFLTVSQNSSVEWLKNHAIGATMPNLNSSVLGSLPISLPDLETQVSIAKAYSAIPRKIRLNTQLNLTLEQIAQTLFKSWFVDFDPVRAKVAVREHFEQRAAEHGEPLPAPAALEEAQNIAAAATIAGLTFDPTDIDGTRALLEAKLAGMEEEQRVQLMEAAALFPAELIELKPETSIPAGWKCEPMAQHIEVVRGLSYKGKGLCGSDSGVPLHNLNSVLEGGGYKYLGIKYYSLDFKDKHRVQPGDLIVTNTEQGHDHLLIGYGALVPKYLAGGLFSHHLYRVRPIEGSPITNQYALNWFLPGVMRSAIAGYSNGTTVNMLPIDALQRPKVTIPSKRLVKSYSELASALHEKSEQLHLENGDLAALRDLLLPKLLSGEIQLNTEPVAEAS